MVLNKCPGVFLPHRGETPFFSSSGLFIFWISINLILPNLYKIIKYFQKVFVEVGHLGKYLNSTRAQQVREPLIKFFDSSLNLTLTFFIPQGATAVRRQPANASRPAIARGAPSHGGDAAPRKPPGPGQEQCRVCGRNFNSDRIEKHVSICSKAAQKKVKVFDATKMRVKGTEAEQFVRKGLPKTEPPKVSFKRSFRGKKRFRFL